MDGVQEVMSVGSDRPRRRPPRRLALAALAVLLGLLLVVIVVAGPGDRQGPRQATPTVVRPTATTAVEDGRPCLPVGWAPSRPAGAPVAGLQIDVPAAGPGSGLDRCDRTAVEGPWTVVVRRTDGSLGRHGAVVTFPVSRPAGGRRVRIGGVNGAADGGVVTWPVAGGHARVRGDLSENELLAIAAGTTIADGHPAVRPPLGLTVAASGPYRPPSVHEMRFGSAEVGEQAALGDGITYTGVTSGGGFEDQLYAVRVSDGGPVGGRSAVVSPIFGGNATLAWEPIPGVVAYVGYSGSQLDDAAVAALQRLAGRTRLLSPRQWLATNPQTTDQVNEPG